MNSAQTSRILVVVKFVKDFLFIWYRIYSSNTLELGIPQIEYPHVSFTTLCQVTDAAVTAGQNAMKNRAAGLWNNRL